MKAFPNVFRKNIKNPNIISKTPFFYEFRPIRRENITMSVTLRRANTPPIIMYLILFLSIYCFQSLYQYLMQNATYRGTIFLN